MTRKPIPIVPCSRSSPGDIDTQSDMGVGQLSSFASCFLVLLKKRYVIEGDGTPVPPSSSSALIRRDQDGTIATLRDSAAGMPLPSLYAIRWTEAFLLKVNSCSHARSVVSRHVQGLIRLASSNKGGPVSRGAIVTTIGVRILEDIIDFRNNLQRCRADSDVEISLYFTKYLTIGVACGYIPRVQT